MELRPYEEADAAATRRVFERAVRVSAASQYSEHQRQAWAPSELDDKARARWARSRAAAHTVVAVESGDVVGFCDLLGANLVDMLYVDPRFGRRGIGSALISHIVDLARARGAAFIETDASLTARPVFERRGFVVVAQQTPVVRGVAMTNFKMRLDLAGA